MKKYLDEVGLAYFWEKIKTKLGDYLPLSGGTMTGDITFADGTFNITQGNNNISFSSSGIIIKSNTNAIGILKNGLVLSSVSNHAINVGNSKLINVADPTANRDAANKLYVDTLFNQAGKIDVVQVNGEALEITDKTVNIDLSDYAKKDVVTDTTDGLMSSTDKVKLDTVEENAQENKIEHITVDGTEQAIVDKTVDLTDAFGKYLPLAGGTMTGNIDMSGQLIAKITHGDNTSVNFANNTVALIAGDSGVSATHNTLILKSANSQIDASSSRITNVLDPQSDSDAATKKYVDDSVKLEDVKLGDKSIVTDKVAVIELDEEPTENSEKMVNSGAVYKAIVENEEVTAAALNDLNKRILYLESAIAQLTA